MAHRGFCLWCWRRPEGFRAELLVSENGLHAGTPSSIVSKMHSTNIEKHDYGRPVKACVQKSSKNPVTSGHAVRPVPVKVVIFRVCLQGGGKPGGRGARGGGLGGRDGG